MFVPHASNHLPVPRFLCTARDAFSIFSWSSNRIRNQTTNNNLNETKDTRDVVAVHRRRRRSYRSDPIEYRCHNFCLQSLTHKRSLSNGNDQTLRIDTTVNLLLLRPANTIWVLKSSNFQLEKWINGKHSFAKKCVCVYFPQISNRISWVMKTVKTPHASLTWICSLLWLMVGSLDKKTRLGCFVAMVPNRVHRIELHIRSEWHSVHLRESKWSVGRFHLWRS